MVRPWKEFSSAIRMHFSGPPVAWPAARTSFNAPSIASVPLLEKKARSSPDAVHSFSASKPWYWL